MARSAPPTLTGLFTCQRLGRSAEWFAVAVALPWSTTLTAVFLTLWLVALVPSFDIPAMGCEPWIPMVGTRRNCVPSWAVIGSQDFGG
jgi:hypothetical protein